eukprot:1306107-Amphidinium_carterae.1
MAGIFGAVCAPEETVGKVLCFLTTSHPKISDGKSTIIVRSSCQTPPRAALTALRDLSSTRAEIFLRCLYVEY